jgi:hypothetical protein
MIFAIVFKYAPSEYSRTKDKVGVEYVEAKGPKEAEQKFGYGDVIAVREISIKDFVLTGRS